jgi:hypothetical protein
MGRAVHHDFPVSEIGGSAPRKRLLWVYSVEKMMVSRALDHRVTGSRLDFTERHLPELGSELVWLTF